jgi:2-dehydro-3-deoxyglucarate aldolase
MVEGGIDAQMKKTEDMTSVMRAKLARGEVSIGTWLTSASPLVAEALASLGFDWLTVDMEHGVSGVEEAAAAFLAAERWGAAAFARLPSADPYLARRLLDSGATGLIVPVVENARDFAEFAAHCAYPPGGRRGVCLSRANGWGERFERYITTFRPFIVPQIETKAGVAEADKIAALECVEALFLGPYDLSASLGTAGDFETAAFKVAAETVMAACRKHGKAPGVHQVPADADALREQIARGFRFIAFGTDLTAMRGALSVFKSALPGAAS